MVLCEWDGLSDGLDIAPSCKAFEVLVFYDAVLEVSEWLAEWYGFLDWVVWKDGLDAV